MKTLIFLLDAVRPDYLNKQEMPYLTELAAKHQYLDMKSLIGYSAGAHPTIWSGLHQERHGRFLIFYRTRHSHLAVMGTILRFIPKRLRPYFMGALKLPLYKIRRLRAKTPKWYKKYIIDYPPGMPPEIAPHIGTGELEPEHEHTIFTVLDQKGISWKGQTDCENRYIGPTPTDSNHWRTSNNKVDFYYSYFADGLGHTHGPHSPQVKNYLNKIDGNIKRIVEAAQGRYGKVNLFIFSDHGMTEITDFINIQKHLEKLPLKLGKDYLAFFDATMARFWVNSPESKKILTETLKRIPKTMLFDKNLIKKYHLNFKDRKWFDILLLFDPGVRSLPDYFVPIKSSIKAYHGYIPEDKDSYGIFITNTFKTSKKEIEIVDIFPTMLTALGLPVPKGIDGKSIIRAKTKGRSSSRAGRPSGSHNRSRRHGTSQ